MAKIALKDGRDYQQIGEAILAAWFRAVDPLNKVALKDLKPEIEAVAREVLDGVVNVYVDDNATNTINIAVPTWPATYQNEKDVTVTIAGPKDLIDYLKLYHQRTSGKNYDEELGQAVVFGCGR